MTGLAMGGLHRSLIEGALEAMGAVGLGSPAFGFDLAAAGLVPAARPGEPPPPSTGGCADWFREGEGDCSCPWVLNELDAIARTVCGGDQDGDTNKPMDCEVVDKRYGLSREGTCAICFRCEHPEGGATNENCHSELYWNRVSERKGCFDVPEVPAPPECFPWVFKLCDSPPVPSSECVCPDTRPRRLSPRLSRRRVDQVVPPGLKVAADGDMCGFEEESIAAARLVWAFLVENMDLVRYAVCRTQPEGVTGYGECVADILNGRRPVGVAVVPSAGIPGVGALPPDERTRAAWWTPTQTVYWNCEHREWSVLLAAITGTVGALDVPTNRLTLTDEYTTRQGLYCMLLRYGSALLHELAHACGSAGDAGSGQFGTPGYKRADHCSHSFRAASLFYGLLAARFPEAGRMCTEVT